MRINETFLSLQGEGHFTGTPAFFLRFAGCNLECPFCDTQHQSFTEMSEEEIVREASTHKPRHIVITGGEPALQLTQSLVDKLHEAGFFIQVETNGTLPLPEGIDWVTVSPKDSPLNEDLKVDELKVLYGEGTDPESVLMSLPLGGNCPLGAEQLGSLRRREGREPRLCLQPLDTGDEMRNRIILRDTIAFVLEHPKWSLSLQTHKMLGIK